VKSANKKQICGHFQVLEYHPSFSVVRFSKDQVKTLFVKLLLCHCAQILISLIITLLDPLHHTMPNDVARGSDLLWR
jgi:hypothetical protein